MVIPQLYFLIKHGHCNAAVKKSPKDKYLAIYPLLLIYMTKISIDIIETRITVIILYLLISSDAISLFLDVTGLITEMDIAQTTVKI